MGPKIVTQCRKEYSKEYFSYLIKKYSQIFNKITFVNTLNFVLDPLLYVDLHGSRYPSKIYILSNNIFIDNEDYKISGLINYYSSNLDNYLYVLKHKIKNINIEIKDVCDRIENINPKIIFQLEITMIYEIIFFRNFEDFKKFTFKAPNNTYIIYDENKKLLIIRFGDYEKYNFSKMKTFACQDCGVDSTNICSNDSHKQYFVNCFTYLNEHCRILSYYPAGLILLDYKIITEKVEKLIIISSEFHDFMYDQLLETSKNQKDKKIEYHCLETNKTKFKQINFKFVPVEKRRRQNIPLNKCISNILVKK